MSAMSQDERKLGQHGQIELGPEDGGGFHDESYKGNPGNPWDNYADTEDGDGTDMVGRVMAQHQQRFSRGGRVANSDKPIADSMSAEYDDLHLRDDLESTYGEDNNAGDDNDNPGENKRRADIIAKIMKSRAKKDRNPYPA